MESSIKIKQEPGLANTHPITGAAKTVAQALEVTVKTERLTSFRVPRDLTLGGLTNGRTVKPVTNKKVYTPNLNAVRNKDTNVKTASAGPKQRTKTERTKDNKGGPKGRAALIQTAGIFSEGLAQRTLQRSKYEKYNNSSKEPGEAIRRPVLRSEIKVDPEEERKRILDLFGSLEDDEMLPDDVKEYGYDANMPVKLENNKLLIIASDHKVDYKTKVVAKSEIKDELAPEAGELLQTLKAGGQHNYFLLQLPDALPGKTECDTRKLENSVNSEELRSEPQRCTIRELEEGHVGKILRYRSGKLKLLLGSTMFDLSMGMDSGFLQELVSIDCNPGERSGNIISLAQIKSKLNASPDWERLFKQ